MHPLHDYIAKQLGDKIKTKKIVVWYDVRSEFAPFVDELRGAPRASSSPKPISAGSIAAKLLEYAGSMFELRAEAEPFVNGDEPEAIVVYLPGCERDRRASVLTELEKAGECYEPQLKRLARNVLRQRYTDGVIDSMLAPERVTYEDLARASSHTASAEPPSILKSLFHDATGKDGILAAWLVSNRKDSEIESKEATSELAKLIRSRLGLELPDSAPLSKFRAVTLRYVLAGEFRSDLQCEPPPCLDGVPTPKTPDEDAAVRELARRLRTNCTDAYEELADQVERELGLRDAHLAASSLGSIDTFRFEERALLQYASELVVGGRFDDALRLVNEREQSFWLDRDFGRKAQWEACRRMAELGSLAVSVLADLGTASGDANSWLGAYTSKNGWYRLDQAQRRLEAWVASLDDEPHERSLGVVRRAYEDACDAMAEGFTKALANAGWSAAQALHQSRIWTEIVSERPKPVAYFLVDAMRFEMGLELLEALPKSSEVSVRHAIAALPSITTVGMAALQPGASSSFSVVEQGGKLGARIDDTFLPDLGARKKSAAARVPKLVDLSLDDLLTLQPSKLSKKVEGAQVIVVRSQEIDQAGETGSNRAARRVMDAVIGDITSAIKRLANVGVEHAVVSADHGHLFASERDESMRTDAPGGKTVELHRRCWIGRGGATPPGCIRVTAAALGYNSDLEFVFPTGSGVFKAGGDLAFHHGGTSLQELVVPVVTVRTKAKASARPQPSTLTVDGMPSSIASRAFSVRLSQGAQVAIGASEQLVRPLVVSGGKQVGYAGMTVPPEELDRTTGCVRLRPGKVVTVAFVLTDETATSLRIVVQDPATDADLYRSPNDIPIQLGI